MYLKKIYRITALFILAVAAKNLYADKLDGWSDYCIKSGGVVEEMPAEIGTKAGMVKGQSKVFCNFYPEHAFIAIGLETFAAEEPNIAATLMKTMQEIGDSSPLWKGKAANPSNNICKNLGGATIGFIAPGGFTNNLGQTDICVFGDGSMASAWSLVYMANHREGYDEIKDKIKSLPLDIELPS